MPDLERDEIRDFVMGTGAIPFAFDNIGDRVKGTITSMQKRQQTDMQTGEPAFWSNGDPKNMLHITLQTELHETDDDEGMRSVYLRGGNFTVAKGKGTSSLNALKDAIKRAGAIAPEIGATLTLEYSGEAPKNKGGFNPAKLYVADYTPPSYGVDINDMA